MGKKKSSARQPAARDDRYSLHQIGEVRRCGMKGFETDETSEMLLVKSGELLLIQNALNTNAALATERDALLEALEGLIAGVTTEINEKGGGGFVLARLSDARKAVKLARTPIEVQS